MLIGELARRAGISGSMLSQVENDRTRPSVSTIYALATELGVSIDALLGNVSINTMGAGLGSVDGHLAALESIADVTSLRA